MQQLYERKKVWDLIHTLCCDSGKSLSNFLFFLEDNQEV